MFRTLSSMKKKELDVTYKKHASHLEGERLNVPHLEGQLKEGK